MRLRHARLARILVLLALTAVSARAHDPTLHGFSLVPFEPPFAAPAFTADALEGGRASLASYRGRHVLLNFWATWCAPCLEEMPSMDALYRDYRDRGLVVVAISSDREGAAVVQDFVERLGVSFPVLLDPQGAVAAQYGARNLPVSFVLDPGGRVVAAAQGARDWNAPEARSVIDEILSRP